MTHRERFMAVVNGETPDRIPWVPRLELWYRAHNTQGTLPAKYQGKTIEQVREMLNCGDPGRNNGILYETVYDNVEIKEEETHSTLTRTFVTPKGSVHELFRIDREAKEKGYSQTPGKAECMFKDDADFEAVKYLIENIRYIPTYEKFTAYQNEVGDNGEVVLECGFDPFYSLMKDYIGLSEVFFALHDYPEEVDTLFHTLWDKQREVVNLLAKSPANIILHGSHYDAMMTPPPIYKKYMQPYLKEVSETFKSNGRILGVHADADSKTLLELYIESGIEVLDCYCTSPMVTVTMEETLERGGDKFVIWGGIPSTILVPEAYAYDDFVDYMKNYFKTLNKYKGKSRVIVAVGDNVVPEADISRVEMISDMVDQFRY